tara:strand:+ start:1743 stop:2120 length:378 start_codon:yes stop_codon:yes gene_type:complete
MTEEGLNASILRLQSFVVETYGRIKDIYKREQQDGDVDKIAQLGMKLANYEGALLTLQGYKADIVASAVVVVPEPEEEEEEEEEEVISDEPPPVRERVMPKDELLKKSRSYRNTTNLDEVRESDE